MANTVIGASVQVDFKSVGNMRKALKEANQELIAMQDKFGDASDQAFAAAKKVAELKDKIQDARETADLFDPGKKFQAFVDVGATIAAGFSAVQGAMALVGTESEDVQRALLKVQGAMAFAQGLGQLRQFGESWDRMIGIVKKATAGVSAFGKALMATGIGLFIAAIGTLVAYWDDLKDAISGTSEMAKAYAEAQKEVTKAVTDARTKLTEVTTAFKLAKEGKISASEALEIYNENLGDTLGKTTDLSDAEATVANNTKAYLKAIELRTKAQVFYAKAAEAAVKAQSGEEVEASFTQSVENFFTTWGVLGAVTGDIFEAQEKSRQENINKFLEMEGQLTEEANKLVAQAIEAESELNVVKEKNNKKYEQEEKRRSEEEKRRSDLQKKLNDDQIKRTEELNKAIETQFEVTESLLSFNLSAKDKEILELGKKYNEQKKILEKGGQSTVALTALFEKQKQEIIDKYAKEEREKEKQFLEDLNKLNEEITIAGITDLREKERAELAISYSEKLAELEKNEKYNEDQKAKLRAALLIKQKIDEDALTEKFRQEDLQKRAKELQDIASNEKLSFNERLTALKSHLDIANQLTFESEDERKNYIQNINNQIDAINKQSHDKKIADLNQLLDLTLGVLSTLRQANDTDLNTKKQQYDRDQKNLQQMLNNKQISEEQYAAKRKQLDEEQNEVLKKSFKRNQIIAIAEAIMNTAKGVTNALGSLPPPFSFIQAAATALLGGLQVNMIRKQKPDLIESGRIPISGGAGGAAPMTPALSAAVQGQALNAEAINNLSNQAVRAYVMNSDIQNNNQRNAYLQRNARLG